MSALPSPHFAETARVLRQGEVAAGLFFGGGGAVLEGDAVGGALRMRVGTGARQEVGFEGTAMKLQIQDAPDGAPWSGTGGFYSGRLRWKLALVECCLALVAAPAVSWAPTGWTYGGDAGFIANVPTRHVQPYFGLRASAAIGVPQSFGVTWQDGSTTVNPTDSFTGRSTAVTTAAGISLELGSWGRFYAEVPGFTYSWTCYGRNGACHEDDHMAFYGALGIEVTLGHGKGPVETPPPPDPPMPDLVPE